MRAALDLSRSRAKRMGHRLILLDKGDYHVYNPLLYEISSGCADERMSGKVMSKGVLSHIAEHARLGGFEFYKGEVGAVDAAARKIVLKDGSSLGFKALIIASGAEVDFFGIPGLKEQAITLKNLDDAVRIRERLMRMIKDERGGREVQIRIMVGGGGATGVETAAELAGNFRHLEREGKIKNGGWTITLVEATPRILGMLPKEISEHARVRLEALGVKVLRDTCIKRVESGKVVLAPRPLREGERSEELLCDFAPEAEKMFEADLIVWAGGVRANPLLADSGFEVDRKGRVAVSDTMEIKGKERENIYAIGDCAALTDPKSGQTVPAMAQAAIDEGAVAAKNIIYDLEGLNTRARFKFKNYPVIAPLGGKSAIAVLGRVHFTGLAGWILRQAADLLYFISILPFFKAIKLWSYGAWIYIKND